ncbi:MAG: hypothetical protein ABI718_05040 [Acidobacteriota bacterium]
MTDMKKKRLVVAILLVASMSSAVMAGRRHPVEHPVPGLAPFGEAILLTFPSLDGQGNLSVPFAVDVQDVSVDGQPAVLGAYVVRIKFDPKSVSFVAVDADNDPYFSARPYFTAAEKANAQGWVRITAVQLSAQQPIGMVHVARAQFRELSPGGAETVRAEMESASSALVKDSEGKFIRTLHIDVKENEDSLP